MNNSKSFRNYSTAKYVNLAIYLVLFAGFAALAIYFGFLVSPYLWVGSAPIDLPEISTALSVMLGALGLAGAFISVYGLVNSVLAIVKNNDDHVIKSFAGYIAIGYVVCISLLLNAVWLYRLTSTNIGYSEIAFVIVVYVIALIIALIATNVPLVKLFGEDEQTNRTMKVLVGSLGAVDLSVGIVFLACALAFISRLGEVANSYLILTKFSVYAAIPLVAFVLFAIAYALIGKAEKKGVEDKAGKGLFVTSLAINGGAIIVCGGGIGTAVLLKAKLNEYFKDLINIVKTIPGYQLKQDDVDSVDLIFSTIPLEQLQKKSSENADKIIYIKNLLNNEETVFIDGCICLCIGIYSMYQRRCSLHRPRRRRRQYHRESSGRCYI